MAIVPNNTDNIDVGRPAKVGGYAFWAPVGTPLPATAAADLDEKFVNLGYVSKDGLSWAPERNTTDHQDWGGDTVETTQESYGETWTITFIESLRGDLLKILFGPENVTIEEPTAVKEHRDQGQLGRAARWSLRLPDEVPEEHPPPDPAQRPRHRNRRGEVHPERSHQLPGDDQDQARHRRTALLPEDRDPEAVGLTPDLWGRARLPARPHSTPSGRRQKEGNPS